MHKMLAWLRPRRRSRRDKLAQKFGEFFGRALSQKRRK